MSTIELHALRRRVAELEDALAMAGAKRLSYRSARETLDELARLPPNWDSYGGQAPTAIAISAAHGLVEAIAERYASTADENSLPWATAPLADGGVQFEWRGPGGAIEVEIGPTGRLGYLVEREQRTIARSRADERVGLGDIVTQLDRVLGR